MNRSSRACSPLASKALVAALCAVLGLTGFGMSAVAEQADAEAVEAVETVEAAQVERAEAPEEPELSEDGEVEPPDEPVEPVAEEAPEPEAATPEAEPAEAAEASATPDEPELQAQNEVIGLFSCEIDPWEVPDQWYTGKPIKPAMTVTYNGIKLKLGVDYDIEYEDNVEAGFATYRVIGKENPNGTYNVRGTYNGTFTILATPITDCSITWPRPQLYTGKPLTPPVVVKYKGKTLKAGTDYTVEYENNVAKGTATIYVDGKGFYDSWAEGTFSIVDHIALSQCSISKISNQYYTGSALKPKPTVSYDGKKLREGVDYTLTYSKNKAIGKATVTIKGKGSYTGSVNRSFSIVLDKGTWKQSGGKWWYSFAHGGYPKSVLLTIGGSTYYFDKSGYVVTGWKELSNGWHYFKSSGAMAKGWQQVGSSWYYFGKGGVMLTGWQNLSGKRYWFASSGAMATGWKQIGGKYYYFESSGAMAKSKWVGNYYLQADGTMAVNKWIGKYHVNASGKWDKTR